jgi:hypothetical protein
MNQQMKQLTAVELMGMMSMGMMMPRAGLSSLR